MATCVVSLAMLACSSVAHDKAPDSTVDSHAAWMHVNGPAAWAPKDPDFPPDLHALPVTLVRARDDGRFILLECWIEVRGGRASITGGDAHRLFVGTWGPIDGQYIAKYRLGYESIPRMSTPGPEETASIAPRGAQLEVGGVVHEKASGLTAQDIDAFVATYASGLAAMGLDPGPPIARP